MATKVLSALESLSLQYEVPIPALAEACASVQGDGVPVLELIERGAESSGIADILRLDEDVYEPSIYATAEWVVGGLAKEARIPVLYIKRGEMLE